MAHVMFPDERYNKHKLQQHRDIVSDAPHANDNSFLELLSTEPLCDARTLSTRMWIIKAHIIN